MVSEGDNRRHLRSISRWRKVKLSKRSRLPESPGLYAVCCLGSVLYIGKAKNIKDRWAGKGHHRYRQARLLPGGVLRYCPVRGGRQAVSSQETAYIRAVRPPWNNSDSDPFWLFLRFRVWGDVFRAPKLVSFVDLYLMAAIAIILVRFHGEISATLEALFIQLVGG